MTDQTPQKNRSNISDSSLSQSDPEERSRRLYTSDRDHQDFISFCRRAGLSTALRYLELFEEVFEILSADHPVTRSWLINFATGKVIQPWKATVFVTRADNQSKQDKLMQLALMRRYPQLYASKKSILRQKIVLSSAPRT
ncbi:hypothetical protein Pst134EB_001867 [Puccinia striiformis f. sp. tritici]|nr:hypothetical protein Pst134EB_001867 [Puccinia striiformis f. sp. tritici]